MTPEQKAEIKAYKRKICLDSMYAHIKQIDHTLTIIQHNLAQVGCDDIAYGCIAAAFGNVAEAICEIKKEKEKNQ